MIDEKMLIERLEEHCEVSREICYCNGVCSECDFKESIQIVKDLASEHNNGWISVEDELPENNRDVYVTYINKMTGDSISSVGWYSQEEKTWFVGHNDTRQKVTAWCPKLPPYKKGE